MRTQTFVATFFYAAALAVAGCGGVEDGASHETEASLGVETSTTVETSSSSSGLVAASPVLGWNMDFVYAGGFVFADKMKMARSWVSCTWDRWDDGRAIPVDAQGWPRSLQSGQHAVTLLTVHGGGQYAVTWTGAGRVEVRDHLGFVSQQANRVVVNTAPNATLQLRILSVPVRNLSVRKVGQAATVVWDPMFVQRLAGARVLRFMQWGMTNGDGGGVPTTWAQRSRPDWYTQNQRYGVAYEHMISLANQVHADAWINIPHLADDGYVRSLATMLRDRLNPNLKVYLEWSNEVWNDAYPQAAYARQRGTALGLGHGDPHLARLQYQARRTRQVFQIFEQVFAGKMTRLVRVVASQTGSDWNDRQMLTFENLAAHADALAIAPYFGHNLGRESSASQVRSGGATYILDQMERVALPNLIAEMRLSAASARRYHLRFIAYEGGQHLVAEPSLQNDTSITSKLEEAQRSPRMYTLYRRLLSAWDAAGGKLFVHYTYTGQWGKWGYWGALENNDSPLSSNGAHKYRAVIDWSKQPH